MPVPTPVSVFHFGPPGGTDVGGILLPPMCYLSRGRVGPELALLRKLAAVAASARNRSRLIEKHRLAVYWPCGRVAGRARHILVGALQRE